MSAGKTNKSTTASQPAIDSAYLSSDSGPALPPHPDNNSHPALQQARATHDLSASLAHNKNKALEYGQEATTPPKVYNLPSRIAKPRQAPYQSTTHQPKQIALLS